MTCPAYRSVLNLPGIWMKWKKLDTKTPGIIIVAMYNISNSPRDIRGVHAQSKTFRAVRQHCRLTLICRIRRWLSGSRWLERSASVTGERKDATVDTRGIRDIFVVYIWSGLRHYACKCPTEGCFRYQVDMELWTRSKLYIIWSMTLKVVVWFELMDCLSRKY